MSTLGVRVIRRRAVPLRWRLPCCVDRAPAAARTSPALQTAGDTESAPPEPKERPRPFHAGRSVTAYSLRRAVRGVHARNAVQMVMVMRASSHPKKRVSSASPLRSLAFGRATSASVSNRAESSLSCMPEPSHRTPTRHLLKPHTTRGRAHGGRCCKNYLRQSRGIGWH